MAHVRSAERMLREPSDRDDPPARGERLEEGRAGADLGARRRPVGARLARPVRVGRDEVPEQHVLLEPELAEHAVDDRRRRFGRARAGQLPLAR